MPLALAVAPTDLADFEEQLAAAAAWNFAGLDLTPWKGADPREAAHVAGSYGLRILVWTATPRESLVAGRDIDLAMQTAMDAVDGALACGAPRVRWHVGKANPQDSLRDQHDLALSKLQAAAPFFEEAGVCAVLASSQVGEGVALGTLPALLDLVAEVDSRGVEVGAAWPRDSQWLRSGAITGLGQLTVDVVEVIHGDLPLGQARQVSLRLIPGCSDAAIRQAMAHWS